MTVSHELPEAARFRRHFGGRLHQMIAWLWILSAPLALASMGALFAAVFYGFVPRGAFMPAPYLAIAIFVVLEFRLVGPVLPTPRALERWGSKALATERLLDDLKAPFDPALPRGRQWRQIRAVRSAGTMGSYGLGVAVYLSGDLVIGAVLMCVGVAITRIWFCQHMANWWAMTQMITDQIYGEAQQTLGDGMTTLLSPTWQQAHGEHFNLRNPWAYKIDGLAGRGSRISISQDGRG